MIQYDNENPWDVLSRVSGSVLPDCVPIGIMSLIWGLTLVILRELEVTDDLAAGLPGGQLLADPFSIRTLGVVIGLLLAVRTNLALNRWMDGISEVQLMLSKWGDAFIALSGFFSSKNCDEAMHERILLFRVRIAHWFSLMSCLAFATLRARHLVSLDDVPIRVMFEDETADFKSTRSFTAERFQDPDKEENDGGQATAFQERESLTHLDADFTKQRVSCLDLLVLAEPTADELDLLDVSTDKVNAVYLWIIQGISEEIRAKTLDAPPPIVSRVFQEISNGKLGFNQAHKVAMVPFPFPFAQMVSALLIILYVLLPIYLEQFTANKYLTSVLSLVVPICYCGLNRVAVELEEPFGTDWNDVDIEVRHEEFLWMLIDVLRQATKPPKDEASKTVGKILDGCSRAQRLIEPKIPDFLAKLEQRQRDEEFLPIASGKD